MSTLSYNCKKLYLTPLMWVRPHSSMDTLSSVAAGPATQQQPQHFCVMSKRKRTHCNTSDTCMHQNKQIYMANISSMVHTAKGWTHTCYPPYPLQYTNTSVSHRSHSTTSVGSTPHQEVTARDTGCVYLQITPNEDTTVESQLHVTPLKRRTPPICGNLYTNAPAPYNQDSSHYKGYRCTLWWEMVHGRICILQRCRTRSTGVA